MNYDDEMIIENCIQIMTSNQEKVRSLHEKLNVLPLNPEHARVNLSSVQEQIIKIDMEQSQFCDLTTIKAKELLDTLKKIEVRLKQQKDYIEQFQQQSRIKLSRAEKISQRAIERMVKERKEAEKKINSALEGYLLELTSAKAKSSSSCKYASKQFANVELQLNALQSQIDAEQSATKQMTKKIYGQFSSQIEELSELLAEEKKEKEAEEDKIIMRLEKTYMKLSSRMKEGSRQREANEQEVVNFLQKLIEKVKHQLIKK